MSKSIGNVISPDEIINKYGADILRIWVVASDYSEDLKIDNQIINYQIDSYRKIRNTIRFLLGNLNDFDPKEMVKADEMPDFEVFLVQTMEDSGPFGAKAVAEIPKDGVAPAIRNAIINATGVAINEIPFTPERVWQKIRESEI